MAASRNSGSPEPPQATADHEALATLVEDVVASALDEAGVRAHSKLCCALSGGVDSVVMFDLLVRLQPRFGYDLAAAHVHHGLSPHADAWQAFCERLCTRAGVPLHVLPVNVRRDHPEGLEAAARHERHRALGMVECDWLALGHHQDDQAETLLFRLLRGTGLRGAGAMAVRQGKRLRPLLAVRRERIAAYARGRGLAWVEDESNADRRYTRNDLRHRVLPAVEVGFPAAVPALARAADHFHEAGELLDELAALDERACGGVELSRPALLALSDARIGNLLRWQARRFGVPAPSRARLREAVRQLRAVALSHPLQASLGALDCCAYRDKVWLAPPVAAVPALPVYWRGEAQLAWAGGVVEFAPLLGGGIGREFLAQAGEVCLGARTPGLRFCLDARRPSRSFKNLCQEAGVPAWMRERLPVLWIDGVAVWIGGIGVAAAFACAPDSPGVMPCWRLFGIAGE